MGRSGVHRVGGDGQRCGSSCPKCPWRRKGTRHGNAYRVLSAASGNGAAGGNAEMSGGNEKQIRSMRPPSRPRETQRLLAAKCVLPQPPPQGCTRVLQPFPPGPTCASPETEPERSLHSTWFVPEGPRVGEEDEVSVNAIPPWSNSLIQASGGSKPGYCFLDVGRALLLCLEAGAGGQTPSLRPAEAEGGLTGGS